MEIYLPIIIVISFLPILLWGYLVSYLDNTPLNARRFLLGIFAGTISVIAVLSVEKIFDIFSLESLDIFVLIAGEKLLSLLPSILLTIFFIAGVVYISAFGFFSSHIGAGTRVFLKNLFITLFFGMIYVLLFSLVSTLDFLNVPVGGGGVVMGVTVFDTLRLVIFYYLMIAIMEEMSKHFSFVLSSFSFADSVRKGVILSIFVALGFAFIENILYLYHLSGGLGINGKVLSTWVFRSIVSVMVHVISSSIVGYYFAQARFGRGGLSYIIVFSKGFFIAVLVHAVFDIALTFGYTSIVFIYLFFGYLYITRLFYREESLAA